MSREASENQKMLYAITALPASIAQLEWLCTKAPAQACSDKTVIHATHQPACYPPQACSVEQLSHEMIIFLVCAHDAA